MNANLTINNINIIKTDIKNLNIVKENKKDKYIKTLHTISIQYKEANIPENLKSQYNQLNNKASDLIKTLKENKNGDKVKVQDEIEMYIRYLKASLCDFKGETYNLRKYITSFLFSSMLFLALSPQFYGFLLPVLFFIPIYIGLKGLKQRSITGYYMTMSVVPMALMTSITWIKYGINVIANPSQAIIEITSNGVNEGLAQLLVYGGPILGIILLLFASLQLYRGIKSRNLFI